MKPIRLISTIFPVIFVAVPGIVLVLIGQMLETGQNETNLFLTVIGSGLIIMSIAILVTRIRNSLTDTLMGHLRNYFDFNERHLKANSAGQLTAGQRIRLNIRTGVKSLSALAFGILLMAVVFVRLSESERSMQMIWIGIAGIAFLLYGLNAIFAHLKDTHGEIQQVTGTLYTSKHHQPATSPRSSSAPKTRYFMHVRPQNDSGDDSPEFPIGGYLAEQIKSQQETQVYTVYYLPDTKTVLSVEEKF